MEFEAYLASKRIDSVRFSAAEPDLWKSWKRDFEHMHPNSFTVRYLNLINPVRRRYQLPVVDIPKPAPAPKPAASANAALKTPEESTTSVSPAPVKSVPKIPRPGMPKPVTKPLIPKPTAASGTLKNAEEPSKSGEPASIESSVSSPLPEVSPPGGESVKNPDEMGVAAGTQPPDITVPAPKPAKPLIPRPVIKPKPKTN